MVSKIMRKACALFCSLGVLTSVSSRYSKSCEKCSQNLISYKSAGAFGIILRCIWAIVRIGVGTIGFLASDDFANWVNLKWDENKKQTLKNWWKVGSILIGADGCLDVMDTVYLSELQANFESLKEIYDKNYKGKSNVILRHFRENDIFMTYNEVRFLETLFEFRGFWKTYCESAKQNVLEILTSITNLSKLEDEKAITEVSVEGLPEYREVKERIVNTLRILGKMGSNIGYVKKIEHDYVNNQVELNFDDVKLKFVEIQKSQQSLCEEVDKNLTGLYNFLQKIKKSLDKD